MIGVLTKASQSDLSSTGPPIPQPLPAGGAGRVEEVQSVTGPVSPEFLNNGQVLF